MKIVIAVAAHRQTWLPEGELYLPMEAGAALRETHLTDGAGRLLTRDDVGPNISRKNAAYCELTVLYWLWRQQEADALGLCHYRRYFAGRRLGPKRERLLTGQQAERLLRDCDCVLPKRRHYFIQSSYDQYTHAHHERDLLVTRQVLAQLPDSRYADAFDTVMRRTSGHRFNMLLMKRPLFEEYCGWLFGVLSAVEAGLDTGGYDAADGRVFGYLAERLLDVWLEVRRPAVRECPVVNLERQHWPRKILRFLRRMLRPARK